MSTSNMPNLPNLPRGAARWAIVGLAVLLLIGLGSAIHSAGWSQGYTLGLLTSRAGGDSLTPYLVYRGGHGLHPFGFGGPFGFFGAIFRFAGLFLVIGLLLKFFGCGRWRGRGEGHGPWHQHYYGPQNAPQSAPQPGEQPGQTSAPAGTPAPPAGSEPAIWPHV
ncbi:MAG: hypothetical protein IT329_02575 [Caldilineaceae bacterium]|nr:hypothetical protein [Caldilineaceae bacterium]